MEKFVSSEVYFNNLVKKISGLSMTQEHLDLIFSDKNHINLHSVKKLMMRYTVVGLMVSKI